MDELTAQRDEARAATLNRLYEARHAILTYMALAPDDSAAHSVFFDINMAIVHIKRSRLEQSAAERPPR